MEQLCAGGVHWVAARALARQGQRQTASCGGAAAFLLPAVTPVGLLKRAARPPPPAPVAAGGLHGRHSPWQHLGGGLCAVLPLGARPPQCLACSGGGTMHHACPTRMPTHAPHACPTCPVPAAPQLCVYLRRRRIIARARRDKRDQRAEAKQAQFLAADEYGPVAAKGAAPQRWWQVWWQRLTGGWGALPVLVGTGAGSCTRAAGQCASQQPLAGAARGTRPSVPACAQPGIVQPQVAAGRSSMR